MGRMLVECKVKRVLTKDRGCYLGLELVRLKTFYEHLQRMSSSCIRCDPKELGNMTQVCFELLRQLW